VFPRALLATLAVTAAALLAPAAASAALTIEADTMELPASAGRVEAVAGASGGRALKVWSNATATRAVATTARSARLVVRARGTGCEGAARIGVDLDGRRVLDQAVSDGFAASAVTIDVPAGAHTVAVSLLNDLYRSHGCDRNLHVDHLTLEDTPTPPPSTAPPGPAPAIGTLEAETMALRGGKPVADATASGRGALLIWGNATASARVTTGRATQVVVRARGEQCQGAPHMRVRVGGREVLATAVPAARWSDHAATVALPAGEHLVEVALTNDQANLPCDRNLFVDVARFLGEPTPPTPPAAPTPAPTPTPTTPRVLLGAAMGARILEDAAYRDVFLRNFDSLTAENEMKMDALAPARGRWSFGTADRMVDLARANGKRVRGHTLVWHNQLPGWLTSGSWTRAELLAIMREHVTTVVRHYRGRVDEWDVVNEPIESDGSLRRSLWLQVIGPDYVEHALRFAREADPDAKLYVNDFNVERPGAKGEGLLRLATELRRQGAPLDGVGFQTHVKTTWYPSQSGLEAMFRRYAELGLEVGVTELDVTTSETPGTTAQRWAAQAVVYRAVGQACRATRACGRVTTWGVSDRSTWLGTHQMPLPFSTDYAPKPAWEALQGARAAR